MMGIELRLLTDGCQRSRGPSEARGSVGCVRRYVFVCLSALVCMPFVSYLAYAGYIDTTGLHEVVYVFKCAAAAACGRGGWCRAGALSVSAAHVRSETEVQLISLRKLL